MVANYFDVHSIIDHFTFLLKFVVVLLEILGESKLLAHSDCLESWELHLCSSQSFLSNFHIVRTNSDGKENSSNGNSCTFTNWFSEGSSHTLLKSIGSSTGKHFVDSENVPRVNSNLHVESILSCLSLEVFVSSNSSSFKSFR